MWLSVLGMCGRLRVSHQCEMRLRLFLISKEVYSIHLTSFIDSNWLSVVWRVFVIVMSAKRSQEVRRRVVRIDWLNFRSSRGWNCHASIHSLLLAFTPSHITQIIIFEAVKQYHLWFRIVYWIQACVRRFSKFSSRLGRMFAYSPHMTNVYWTQAGFTVIGYSVSILTSMIFWQYLWRYCAYSVRKSWSSHEGHYLRVPTPIVWIRPRHSITVACMFSSG